MPAKKLPELTPRIPTPTTVGAEDADDIENRGQHRHGDEAGDDARRVTRYLIGLIAMESRASICSVARMVPSSAAMAEPVLPVTMNAESTGPNSRNRLRAVAEPSQLSALNLRQAVVALKSHHHAGKKTRKRDHRQRIHADGFDVVDDQVKFCRRRNACMIAEMRKINIFPIPAI